MAYLVTADLRAATARFPGLTITTAEAADGRVTTIISQMSNYFDRLAGDHFETTAATTFIFDGSKIAGTRILEFPRRIQTVTNVSLVGADHVTLTTLPTASYTIHSSFTEPSIADIGPYYSQSGWDGLELVGGGDNSLTGGLPSTIAQWALPFWARAISVTGDWDWPSCPELVANAVAWLCVNLVRTNQLPSGLQSFNSGRARFDMSERRGTEEPTTNTVVNHALATYGRKASSIEAI